MREKPRDWEGLPLLLGVRETSEVIGYGQARVRDLCRKNIMPNIRLGRAYKIPKEALRTWINAQTNK